MPLPNLLEKIGKAFKMRNMGPAQIHLISKRYAGEPIRRPDAPISACILLYKQSGENRMNMREIYRHKAQIHAILIIACKNSMNYIDYSEATH